MALEESWGLKSILDAAEDVAVFIADFRMDKILYCNHIVTLKTGRHADSSIGNMWDEAKELTDLFKDGRSTHKCTMKSTPFGSNKNVTVTPVIWTGGVKAYAYLISDHVENKEEQEREIIFNTLGRSYLSIQTFDFEDDLVYTVFQKSNEGRTAFKPLPFEEWRSRLLFDYIHPEDEVNVKKFLNQNTILSELNKNPEGLSFNFRRLCDNDVYRWTECRFSRLPELADTNKIICTQKDIQGELFVNRESLKNQLIMQSLTNVYRSVYLLDYTTGEYSTVKPDELLFGIPREGMYDEILVITSELISDEGQKKDLNEYFSLEALKEAFNSGIENIGREYNSKISKDVDWMSISAFRPPGMQGLENKCVITYMDITEHKRVEAERNESNVAIDVLSSKYVAVFLVKRSDYSFHTIKLPSAYRFMEHEYKNILDMFQYYLSAYVLDEYRDILRSNVDCSAFHEGGEGEITKQEYIFRNVNNQWLRLVIALVPGGVDEGELIIAFEDYDEIMEQHSLSSVYSKMMLADYENMFEYDADTDTFFELHYDGERLIREAADGDGNASLEFHAVHSLHPDDLPIFMSACNRETIESCIRNKKSVTHLYLRKMVDGAYHSYMYGFHYHEELGKKCVLIMERDADKEIV